jgi:universal stress protein A
MKVLVALADDYCQNKVFQYLTSIKWESGTKVRILHVMDKAKGTTSDKRQRLEAGWKLLDDFAKRLRIAHPQLKVETEIHEGNPNRYIVRDSREWDADLLIIGAHGRRGLDKLFLGSVSEVVCKDCECSIVLVKLDDSIVDIQLEEADLPQQLCSINLFKDESEMAI